MSEKPKDLRPYISFSDELEEKDTLLDSIMEEFHELAIVPAGFREGGARNYDLAMGPAGRIIKVLKTDTPKENKF